MTIWAPAYLTMGEALEIIRKQEEEAGIQDKDFPTWQERHKYRDEKIEAWKKAHPGEPWGLDKLMLEDQKRRLQLEAEAAKGKD